MEVSIDKLPNPKLAFNNVYYLHGPKIGKNISAINLFNLYLTCEYNETEPNKSPNNMYTLQVSQVIRSIYRLELGKKVNINIVNDKIEELSNILYEIMPEDFNQFMQLIDINFGNSIKTYIKDTCINEFQILDVNYKNTNGRIKILKLMDKNNNNVKFGMVTANTKFTFINSSQMIKLEKLSYEILNVGGLSSQFDTIFTKVFLSRIVPIEVYKSFGIQHVKGVILYGPPGCGKTRMARSIAEILNCKNIQIINGPELLNKYVGQSEENVRKIFADAEKNPGELYVKIFDEFDALCKTRGTGGAGGGANDGVVTQLLSKIDGVESLNNIILIGLTNRKDVIDEAIMRPGRFEVHIEVGLPDDEGRIEIFKIHMKELSKNNYLDKDIDIVQLSKLTENFTGAEIESVVKNAVSKSIRSKINMDKITESAQDVKNILINQQTFIDVILKTESMYGNTQNNILNLSSKIHIKNDNINKKIHNIIDFINASDRSQIIVISGSPKSGKTSIACSVGAELLKNIKYIRYLNSATFLNKSEYEKIKILNSTMIDKTGGLIIMDNIESILEFVPPNRFSNIIFQFLKSVFYDTKNHIIINVVHQDDLQILGFLESVDLFIKS